MPRSLRAVTAPTGQDVLSLLVPSLAGALDGSAPALLPLPTGATRGPIIDELRPDLPLEVDDTALVLPTSGSTGTAKGVLLSSAALRHAASASHEHLGGHGQWLLALPVTHIAGLMVLVRSLDSRMQPEVVDLYGGFSAAAFASATARLDPGVRRYTSLVPTQLRRLLDAGTDLTAYDAILLGGAAAPEWLLNRASEAGARIVVSYGMTETSGGCVYDGQPLDGVHVEVCDGGRISLSGPMLFSGYRLRPDLTEEALVNGRYVTNDIGRWTADRRLHVLARTDDVIVSGGVNISASSVERVLNAHPHVRACGVVGRPDDEWGARVVAVIEPADARRVPGLDELQSFARGLLDAAAVPRELLVVGLLPVLASGKPDRAALRALLMVESEGGEG